MRTKITALAAIVLALTSVSATAGFLRSPLSYPPYCNGCMNTVLDHSMARNPNGRYPYYDKSTGFGLDHFIRAFNGEYANGALKSNDYRSSDYVCVGGTIFLYPAPGKPRMTNDSGCTQHYASYDDHPGYDYYATMGTPVYAEASGYIVNNGGQICVLNGLTKCADFGYVGIDHQNGYITQYGHLSRIYYTVPHTWVG